MLLIDHLSKVTRAHIGCYIRLDGWGIMSGLASPANKMECYRIRDVTHTSVQLKRWRARYGSSVSSGFMAQKAVIYTRKEFLDLPTRPEGTRS
jgi:hypothetical protein